MRRRKRWDDPDEQTDGREGVDERRWDQAREPVKRRRHEWMAATTGFVGMAGVAVVCNGTGKRSLSEASEYVEAALKDANAVTILIGFVNDLVVAASSGSVAVNHTPVFRTAELCLLLTLMLLWLLDLCVDTPSRFQRLERLSVIVVRQNGVRMFFSVRAVKALHELIGPWGWLLMPMGNYICLLIGIDSATPASVTAGDAARPPVYGVVSQVVR